MEEPTPNCRNLPPPLPRQETSTGSKAGKPFLKVLASGLGLYAALLGFIVLSGTEQIVYCATYTFMSCMTATVATAIWCYKDKQVWSWGRIIVTVVGFYLALVFIQLQGKAQR